MEVKVLEHEGIANDNILMIRAGPMRRQAKLNAGLPFQFPSLPLNANPFKVEVFQPLGSKSLILSPDAEVYSVNLPATDHATWSKIQLEIKDMPVGGTGGTGGMEGQNNTEPLPPREPVGDDLIEDGSKNEDQISNKKAQNDESLRRVEKAKAEAALAAKGYLHKHNLVNFVQEMLTTVLKEKPFDPYCYMRDYARGQLAPKQPEPPAAAEEEADNFGEDEDSIRAVDGKGNLAQDVPGHRVPVKFQVEGLSYQKLLADSALTSKVVAVIQQQFAKEVGIDEKSISMTLSSGSVKVDAVLTTPDLKTAQNVHQVLGERKAVSVANITKALTDLEGISNATDGTIACGEIEVLPIQSDLSEAGEDNTKWYQQSQQAMTLEGETCMLTISEDTVNSRIRFDVFSPAKEPRYRWVVCSQAEFDACCADAKGTTKSEKMMDAITRLFTEELEENRPPVDSFESTPEPRAVSASVSPESDIAHQLAIWATDHSAQEAVSQEEEKAVAEDEVLDQPATEQPAPAAPTQEQTRELPTEKAEADFTSRELPPGLFGNEEATTTASASAPAPPLEATPPAQPKPQKPRPGGPAAKASAEVKAKGQSAVIDGLRNGQLEAVVVDMETKAATKEAAADKVEEPKPAAVAPPALAEAALTEASPAPEQWNSSAFFRPSVGSWVAPVSPKALAKAASDQAERNKIAAEKEAASAQAAAASAPAPVEAKEEPSASDLKADNEKLAGKNDALRAEIARLKARLGESGDAAPAAAASAAPATAAPQAAPAPAAAEAATQARSLPQEIATAAATAAQAATQGPAEATKEEKPFDQLIFDDVFDKCVGELYQEHKKKNEELRASYDRLSQENTQLVQEQERMKQMLLRLCYGLEGMATDIRAAVGEPTFKPPMKSINLEAENKDLRQNIVAMYEANRKLRTDNAVLSSELSSRGVSRAASQMTNPTPFPAT
mmetsp:Transcript_12325/g.23054  ORF Transcript_12325/g.23054 Transcript_12325/m.23054 type:complete len:953 (-) Transcript_12325:143-3001(-)